MADIHYQIPTSVLGGENGSASQEASYPKAEEVIQPLSQEVYPDLTPTTQGEHDPALARRFFTVVSNIEQLPDARLIDLQAIIQDFESFHATATEENLSETALQKARNLLRQSPEPLEDRLANQERVLSRKVFLRPPFVKNEVSEAQAEKEWVQRGIKGQSFWYLNGYFYYEVEHAGSEPTVISYHVADEGVYKGVNGTPAAMIPTEMDSLLAAARLSRDEARHQMYPVDEAISDLLDGEGNSLDNLDYLDRLKH